MPEMEIQLTNPFEANPSQDCERILVEGMRGGSEEITLVAGSLVEPGDTKLGQIEEAHIMLAAVSYIKDGAFFSELAYDTSRRRRPSQEETLQAYEKTVGPIHDLTELSPEHTIWLQQTCLNIVHEADRQFVASYVLAKPAWRKGWLDAILYSTAIERDLPFVLRSGALRSPKPGEDVGPLVRMEMSMVYAAGLLLPDVRYMRSMMAQSPDPIPTQGWRNFLRPQRRTKDQ